MIASFDLDGVILMDGLPGVRPGPNDVLITGRSFEEYVETMEELHELGILTIPYFNPISFKDKTRINSGQHKGNTINMLNKAGKNIVIVYDDDPIQLAEIRKLVPDVKTVLLEHDLVEKENTRRHASGKNR